MAQNRNLNIVVGVALAGIVATVTFTFTPASDEPAVEAETPAAVAETPADVTPAVAAPDVDCDNIEARCKANDCPTDLHGQRRHR